MADEPATWGGAREGAGRRPVPARDLAISVTVSMPRWLARSLDRESRRQKVRRSRLVVAILKRALGRRAAARAAAED